MAAAALLAGGLATASAAPAAAAQPCTGAASPRVQHVVVILMENKDETSVIGSGQAPYLNQLARACAMAADYHGVAHPSLPNYLALTGGSTFGVTDDKPPSVHRLGGASIFSQLGGDWRSYQESMAVPCQKYGKGSYAPKHNPAAYYTRLTDCAANDVPLPAHPTFDAAFTFVTPNLAHDMHNGSVAQGDAWLSTFVPTVLASPQYQAGTLALFITWDENDGPNHAAGNRVPCIAVAPSVRPSTVLSARYDHYALLATWEELLGLPRLGQAAGAPVLSGPLAL